MFVGGNAEAARRAGINVKAIYTWVFVLCSTLAALGGILAASRLAASNQATGAGDLNLNAIAAAAKKNQSGVKDVVRAVAMSELMRKR